MKTLILITLLLTTACVSMTQRKYNRAVEACKKETLFDADRICHRDNRYLLAWGELSFADQVDRCIERQNQTYEVCSNFVLNWQYQQQALNQQRIQGLNNAFSNFNNKVSQPIKSPVNCKSYRQYDGSYQTHCW